MARKTKAPADAAGLVQVRILRAHDHRIAPARILAFTAGSEPWVAPEVAQALIGAGAAEPITADTED